MGNSEHRAMGPAAATAARRGEERSGAGIPGHASTASPPAGAPSQAVASEALAERSERRPVDVVQVYLNACLRVLGDR